MILIELPLRLVNGSNAREHWAVRKKRAKEHRGTAHAAVWARVVRLDTHVAERWCGLGDERLLVTITRLGPRALDSDNLAISAKHCRDGIADALIINDNNPRVTWAYEQEKSRTYGVRIRIERREQ